ncbi:hypothetical protein [Microbacterium aurum]|uniref:hypothetical protein n=1 Tax=Microbacterium aurum TaxID=36805 RepID=UPI0028ED761F|nr:hypothetical protein [Microbacterium aurum]
MTVWAEKPHDTGSAVWGCNTCERGAWCSDHTTALLEARTHARTHNERTVTIIRAHHGPTANKTRDKTIRKLHTAGHTIRQIAATVGLSNAGVIKALRRIKANAS